MEKLQLPVILPTVPASSRAIPSSQSARARAPAPPPPVSGATPVDVPASAASSSLNRRGATLAALMNPSAQSFSAWPAPPNSARKLNTRGGAGTALSETNLGAAHGKPPLLLEVEAFVRRELHHLGQAAPTLGDGSRHKRDGAEEDPFPPPPPGAGASSRSSTAALTSSSMVPASRELIVSSSSGGGKKHAPQREGFRYTAQAVLTEQQQQQQQQPEPPVLSRAAVAAAGTDPKALGSAERLLVFREAFVLLSVHFGEYRHMLDAIRNEYDAALEVGERHRRHAIELERELATARSYVQFIVDAETNELKKRAAEAERLAEERQKLGTSLKADLIAATQRFNMQQIQLEKLQTEESDSHFRNKILSEGLRNESDRQAKVAETLRKVRMENTKLQTYCQLMEENARDDQITIEELKEKVRVLEHGFASQTAALAAARTAPLQVPLASSGAGGAGRFMAVARAALSQSVNPGPSLLHHQSISEPSALATSGVPRSLLSSDTVDKQVDELENKLMLAVTKQKQMQRTINDLKANLAEQQTKLAAFMQKRGDRPSTPRPKWKSLRGIVAHFEPKDDSTSDAIVEELRRCIDESKKRHRRDVEAKALSRAVQEWLGEENLCESDLASFSASFVGLGNGDDVPAFLRYHGRVRNKRLRKGDVEQLLKSFWQARQERRRAEASDVAPIGTFASEWLRASTASEMHAIEIAYNMMDVCSAHTYDTDCLLFHDIMLGKLSEEVYHDSQQALEQLERMIRNSDKKHSTGFVTRQHLFKLIGKVYPGKSRENILKLRFALVANCDADGNVNYEELLSEDANGNQTRFVEYLRRQHVEESQEALIDVEEAVRAQANDEKMVTMFNVRTAIRQLDAAMPESQIIKIVAVGYRIPEEQVDVTEQSAECDVRDFIRRVKAGALVRRFSPKPTANDADDNIVVPSPAIVPEEDTPTVDDSHDEMSWSVSTAAAGGATNESEAAALHV